MKTIQIMRSYKDMQLNRQVYVGEIFEVDNDRAKVLVNMGLAAVIEKPKEYDLTPPFKTPEELTELSN